MVLRPLVSADLPAAHALSQAVGWPHRLADWQLLQGLGEGVAADAAGTLVGTALWWSFPPVGKTLGLASIGLVIVAPDRQGQGLGRRLMHAVLERAGPQHILRLNATESGSPLYRGLGFYDTGGLRQHQGRLHQHSKSAAGPDLRPLGPADHAAVARLDGAATGLDRDAMLDRLYAAGEGLVMERDGQVVGYGLRRAFGRGEIVGPVIAGCEADGLRLIQALAGAAAGFVRIDIPAGLSVVPAWLDSAGLPEVDALTTMDLGAGGPAPARAADGTAVYALAAQALG